jgi:outer membrane protein TolC
MLAVPLGLCALAGCIVLEHASPVANSASSDEVRRTSFQANAEAADAPALAAPLRISDPALSNALLPAYLARALAENRDVQAARLNALAMRARVPQVTALEDPMVQNGIWPFPSNGPQYALMGFMPYELMVTQQFPWMGTLKLRGCVAQEEAKLALWQLAEAQLAVVAEVKTAYFTLRASEQIIGLLEENRVLAEQIVEIARARLATGGNEQDVLRAEVAVASIDRELALLESEVTESQAELSQLMHGEIEAPRAVGDAPLPLSLGVTLDQLTSMALVARPEIQARQVEVQRDRHQVELARKKYWPNFNAGIGYSTMTTVNNPSPLADGRDNVGFVLGFNLPIYREKLDAGVLEAETRVLADARRLESERDKAHRELRTLLAQARAQEKTLSLLEDRIAPKSQLALRNAAAGYRTGTLDFVTLNTAREELLEIRIQVARTEAALGRALAALEKAVGLQLDAVTRNASGSLRRTEADEPPSPPSDRSGPF